MNQSNENNGTNNHDQNNGKNEPMKTQENNVPGRGKNNSTLKDKVPKSLTPNGIKKSAMSAATNKAINSTPIGNSETAQKAAKAAEVATKVAKTVGKIAVKIKAIGAALISILGNPVTWIVLAVLILVWSLVISVFSFTQTVGKNDNADGCYGVGAGNSSTVVFQEGDTEMDRANKMVTWLLSQPGWEINGGEPLSKNQAFAIIGNFMAESGIDPAIIEHTAPDREEHLGADNDKVYVWTQKHTANGVNIGLGIAQWTWNPGRAGDLIQKARDTGTQWYEIQPQLELMKDEMDSAYYKNALIGEGFDKKDDDIAKLAMAFHDGYERSADTPQMAARRGEMGEKVAEQYVGGSSTGGRSGGSCTRGQRGSADMSSAVALAISIAYEPSERAKATVTDGSGIHQAKPEYLDAKKMAEEASGPDPQSTLYASCDRVVATVVKNTLDPDIPWGNVYAQLQYFEGDEDWVEINSKEETEPGDVFIVHSGDRQHVVIYIGDYDGVDSIVQGSWTDQVANIQSAYMKDEIGTGRGYRAFRFVGDPVRTDTSVLE